MNHPQTQVADALRAALTKVEVLRRQNKDLMDAAREPIAVVSMSCRFPGGVSTPDDLWKLLMDGKDVISGFPENRGWEHYQLGANSAREGGFVYDADHFDPAFFGISPREALAADPQQRLLLEISWEAIERAGIRPATLHESRSGVFAGISSNGYISQHSQANLQDWKDYVATGSLTSVASGRIAYTLGLQGPAISVDTACSSSLVAIHLAVQALQRGECMLALAGGVTVMATPTAFISLDADSAGSADGRCKSFSAAADGAGWSEGAGVLLLERLSDARRNGHPVLALLKGSAINQDGRSQGLTAPNGLAQEKVIQQALHSAQLSPNDIDAVEAHGTGTVLGDPIEAQALLATYGENRSPEHPLWLGSLKSNLGHMQAAAGVGGVIKMVLAMQHSLLPRTLHAETPSPHIDWSSGAMRLLSQPAPWQSNGHPRRAAVSSFGISGTNAHVILEEAPATDSSPAEVIQANTASPLPAWPVLLSARSETALRAQAQRLREHLQQQEDLSLLDLAFSLATARTQFEHRAAVVAHDRDDLLAALDSLASGRPAPNTMLGDSRSGGKFALLFTGQGSQRPAMGRALYQAFPVFRDALDAACALLDRTLAGLDLSDIADVIPNRDHPPSLREVLFAPEGSPLAALLDQTAYTQPALFALEVALFRLLESLGLKPHLLLGHSIGELAAAHLADVFSLEDACSLVAARARLMQALRRDGAMVTLQASEAELLPLLDQHKGRVSIAALNAPSSSVIAGDEDAVLEIARHFQELGRRTSRLRVSHAFHSPHMDGMLDAFQRAAEGISFHPARIPLVSNLSGARASDQQLGRPDYWVSHVRQTVRFVDGARTLYDEGIRTFLELGPHGVLSALAQEAIQTEETNDTGAHFIPSLRKNRNEVDALLSAVALLHVHGVPLDWNAFFSPFAPKRVDLPTYAFQRERFWLEASSRSPIAHGESEARYLLAGEKLELPDGSFLHFLDAGPGAQPYLADHVVFERIVVPGAFYVAVLLAIAESHWPDQGLELKDVQFHRVLTFEGPSEQARLHVQLTPNGERSQFQATVGTREENNWTIHATCSIGPLGASDPSLRPMRPIPETKAHDSTITELVDACRDMGIDWNPRWRWFRRASRIDERTGFGRFEPPDTVPIDDAPVPGGLIDNLFGLAFDGTRSRSVSPEFPWGMERVVWYGRPLSSTCWGEYVQRTSASSPADITLWNEHGIPLAQIDGFTARAGSREQLFHHKITHNLYHLNWTKLPDSAPRSNPRWALLGSRNWEHSPFPGPAEELSWYGDLKALQVALDQGITPPEVVLAPMTASLPAGDENAEAVHRAAEQALELLQGWVSDTRLTSCRLMLLTCRAVAAGEGEDVLDLAHSTVWGLTRTAQNEHPDHSFFLVDTDGTEASQSALLAALDFEDRQLALRAGHRFVPRLARLPQVSASQLSINTEGTVLITGGTGMIGSLAARRLIEKHGVKHLLLTSRQGPSAPGVEALQRELNAAGAETVTIAACDASDRYALQALLEAIPDAHPLTGVLHTAAVLDDAVLEALTPDKLDRVFKPKVNAAWNLHQMTQGRDLAFFVLFSSVSGILGSPGQGNYAAANTFLDALAQHRHFRGMPASSLAWGYWEQKSNLTAHLSDADRARIRKAGVLPISSEQGLDLLDASLRRPEAAIMTARLDVQALATQLFAGRLVAGLTGGSRRRDVSSADPAAAKSLRRHLSALPEGERERALLDLVRREIAAVLGLTFPSRIEIDRPLLDVGLDSLMAIQLRNALSRHFNTPLPATLVFNEPTPGAIVQFLLRMLKTEEPPVAAATGHVVSDSALSHATQLTPLSAGQRRLWFLDQLFPDIPLNNMHVAWRIRGALDISLLRRSFAALAQRHESARTLFINVQGEPRALILPADANHCEIEYFDLTGDPSRFSKLESLSLEHRTRVFDLAQSPLWRAAVITLEREEHIFLFTQHHIISDAWSVGILINELMLLYRAGADERALTRPVAHYSDYVRWQRAELHSASHRASLNWWKQRLAQVPRLDLPECHSKPALSHAGRECRVQLSAEFSNRLRELARREGCTLFQLLLSALSTVLYRHSGQTDFIIGTFVAGRERSEFADVAGFFVNTLAIRCDLSGSPTFLALLRRLRGIVVESLQHQNVPLDEIVSEVGADRGQDLSPLIQASFGLFPGTDRMEPSSPSWTLLDSLRGDGGVDGIAKFNLGFALCDGSDGIYGTIEYSTDLFEHEAVQRIVRHFEVVLGSAIADLDIPIGRMQILGEEERSQILFDWNSTYLAPPPAKCLHDAIALQSQRNPTACAVLFDHGCLTYRELEARSNQIAHALRSMGVVAGARVGICLERSFELVISLLAILKAGAAYVPLDPDYPVDRIAFMLDDAKVFALITASSLEARWPDHTVRSLRLDVDAHIIERQPTSSLEVSVSPECLAYVIYTSGSTGRPKGVEITHSALVNTLTHFAQEIAVTPDDTLLAVTSLSFDMGTLEIFMPLMQGAAIRLASREQIMDGYALQREVPYATIMQATPATWRLLLEANWEGNKKLRLLCGGEALPWSLALKLVERAKAVWNGYGPTETAIYSTAWRVERDRDRTLLGKGISNTSLYVLDSNGELAPIGVPGELYIGGAGVARGYLDRPSLTAERFLPDPYSRTAHRRMYRTGDKVRWTADGSLEYLGRFDHQIKLRGFRIELGEIEAVLAGHPQILSCVVVLHGNGDDSLLIAYYTSVDDRDIAQTALKEHLGKDLPAYMVPSAFTRMSEFPLTPNRKIDRNALRQLGRPEKQELPPSPIDDHLGPLAGVWREVLGVEPASGRTFFELGGTSLQLVRLQNRMRERLGTEISVAELMRYPTLEALAARIEQRKVPAVPSTSVQRHAEDRDNKSDNRIHESGNLSSHEIATPLSGDFNDIRSIVASGTDKDGPLVHLFRQAEKVGAHEDGQHFLSAATQIRLRTQLESPQTTGTTAEEQPFQLMHGPTSPLVICIPPFLLPSGPIVYARLVSNLKNRRNVWVIPHPGYGEGQTLITQLSELIVSRAQSVLQCAEDKPFVLLGHSAGAWIAYMVAAAIEQLGHRAAGVVLLDPLEKTQITPGVIAAQQSISLKQASLLGGISDTSLTASFWYQQLSFSQMAEELPKWRPKAPTIHIRASENINGQKIEEHPQSSLSTLLISVSGDHNSMLHNQETAAAVDDWLLSLQLELEQIPI